jgi:WD40 repeat protein
MEQGLGPASSLGPTTLRLWDATGKEVRTFGNSAPAGDQPKFRSEQCFFSPDGKYLAAVGSEGAARGIVRVWTVAGGDKSLQLPNYSTPTGPVVFSPDSKQMVETCARKVRLWDPATAKLFQEIDTPCDACAVAVFSPDGKYLAAGDRKDLRVWRLPAAELVTQLAEVEAFLFAPNSRTLAALIEGKIRVRSTAAPAGRCGSGPRHSPTIGPWKEMLLSPVKGLVGHSLTRRTVNR